MAASTEVGNGLSFQESPIDDGTPLVLKKTFNLQKNSEMILRHFKEVKFQAKLGNFYYTDSLQNPLFHENTTQKCFKLQVQHKNSTETDNRVFVKDGGNQIASNSDARFHRPRIPPLRVSNTDWHKPQVAARLASRSYRPPTLSKQCAELRARMGVFIGPALAGLVTTTQACVWGKGESLPSGPTDDESNNKVENKYVRPYEPSISQLCSPIFLTFAETSQRGIAESNPAIKRLVPSAHFPNHVPDSTNTEQAREQEQRRERESSGREQDEKWRTEYFDIFFTFLSRAEVQIFNV
ncbi:hypothetical protein WN51_06179 [Melipona quadrifasciata]|uniref:Uncharacterized protein n=1 Tax=Melipona quadrifasciata TaxID=166423 RepID=A0A0N0U369_9HYME|nr:hypothetical protein WN51_06179 [Melipona quadrifasciata]